jgi:hypothetical protein
MKRLLWLVGLAGIWVPSLGQDAPKIPATRVAGTITAIVSDGLSLVGSSDGLPLVGSKVIFTSSKGVIQVVTDQSGRYQAFLNPDTVYRVEVRAEGLCTVHRPAFRPLASGALSFDFTMVVCANIDPVEVDATGEREVYQEESLDREGVDFPVMVAFGTRSAQGGSVTYGPLHVSPRNVLPVTMAYERKTIRGDVAVLDVTNHLVMVRGNVWVYDGFSPARHLHCTVLNLRDTSELHPCGTDQ